MFRKITSIFLIAAFALMFAGCYTQTFVVGNGAQGSTQVEAKQWYILWGLVPLNTVNSNSMAGNADDYTIVTKHTFVDVLMGIVTGIVTVSPKTVRVTR